MSFDEVGTRVGLNAIYQLSEWRGLLRTEPTVILVDDISILLICNVHVHACIDSNT